MNSMIEITDLALIIELAVAPVFLLAGIAGFLNVMSGRLGRIVGVSFLIAFAARKILGAPLSLIHI